LGEHRLCKPGVAGSSPAISTSKPDINICEVIAQFFDIYAGKTRSIIRFCNLSICVKATKGIRWMPWHRQAMKDVVSCDKLR
jgi:hypothetical protein